MRINFKTVLVLVLLLSATNAGAQIVILDNPGDFSGSEAIIDFEGLGLPGTLVPMVDGVFFELSPSGIAPRLISDTSPHEFGPPGAASLDPVSAPFDRVNGYNDLIITFPGPVNRMGFEMRANFRDDEIDMTIFCLDDGVVVDSFTFDTRVNSRYKFYAFESASTFDQVLVDTEFTTNGYWRMDNLRYEQTTPICECFGFDPPADQSPIKVKKNRVIPLKAELVSVEDGTPKTDADLLTPPVVEVSFTPAVGGEAIDVTDDALSSGKGTDGNQFEFSTDDWKWHFNLKTKNYTAAGTYTVRILSGDSSEYIVDPECFVQFVIE